MFFRSSKTAFQRFTRTSKVFHGLLTVGGVGIAGWGFASQSNLPKYGFYRQEDLEKFKQHQRVLISSQVGETADSAEQGHTSTFKVFNAKTNTWYYCKFPPSQAEIANEMVGSTIANQLFPKAPVTSMYLDNTNTFTVLVNNVLAALGAGVTAYRIGIASPAPNMPHQNLNNYLEHLRDSGASIEEQKNEIDILQLGPSYAVSNIVGSSDAKFANHVVIQNLGTVLPIDWGCLTNPNIELVEIPHPSKLGLSEKATPEEITRAQAAYMLQKGLIKEFMPEFMSDNLQAQQMLAICNKAGRLGGVSEGFDIDDNNVVDAQKTDAYYLEMFDGFVESLAKDIIKINEIHQRAQKLDAEAIAANVSGLPIPKLEEQAVARVNAIRAGYR